jgi:hypothetical protein
MPALFSQSKYSYQGSEKRCSQQVWNKIRNMKPCIRSHVRNMGAPLSVNIEEKV